VPGSSWSWRAACPPSPAGHSNTQRLPTTLQGFTGLKERVSGGSTVWGAYHLPQNRDVCMVSSGDGSLHLYKYSYPDQRRIKVGLGGCDWLWRCRRLCAQVQRRWAPGPAIAWDAPIRRLGTCPVVAAVQAWG
jgi:hypothetical protein